MTKLFTMDELFGTTFMDDFFFNKGMLKDMHPYEIVSDEESNKTTIAYQAVGISKDDVKVVVKKQNGITYLCIEGKTHNKVLNKDFSVNGKFKISKPEELDKVQFEVLNGVIYVYLYHKEYKNDIPVEMI